MWNHHSGCGIRIENCWNPNTGITIVWMESEYKITGIRIGDVESTRGLIHCYAMIH